MKWKNILTSSKRTLNLVRCLSLKVLKFTSLSPNVLAFLPLLFSETHSLKLHAIQVQLPWRERGRHSPHHCCPEIYANTFWMRTRKKSRGRRGEGDRGARELGALWGFFPLRESAIFRKNSPPFVFLGHEANLMSDNRTGAVSLRFAFSAKNKKISTLYFIISKNLEKKLFEMYPNVFSGDFLNFF